MTRRTFVMLVCRFVGLLAAMELIEGKFGVTGFARLYDPRYLSGTDRRFWITFPVALPIVMCASGIAIGVLSTQLASRVEKGGDVASVRFGYAVSAVLISLATLQGCFAVASVAARDYQMSDPTLRMLTVPSATNWPFVAIPLYGLALTWLFKRALCANPKVN